MFVPPGEDLSVLRPSTSQIAPENWRVLARFWYPVAVAGDLKQEPMKGLLLDVELVIYRIGDQVAVARDRCPHRHIRLSAGRIVADQIVCPFHGLSFDATGKCTRVPALGRDARLPPSYRLRSFRSEVRYGLVWACLDDESSEKVPDLPAAAAADPDRLAYAAARDWPASAPRQIENFIDIAHFPFIHSRSVGGDPIAALSPGTIEQTDSGLILTTTYHEHREGDEAMDVDLTYILTLPFIVELRSRQASSATLRLHMFDVVAPISAYRSRVFMIFITGSAHGPRPSRESQAMQGGGAMIIEEDIAILGELAQPDLPLDQKQEIHLPVDRISLEYRKRLRTLGLGTR